MKGFKAMLNVLIMIVVVGTDAAFNQTIKLNGHVTRAESRSGKLSVYKNETGESSGLTLTYDAMLEMDQDGVPIESHSFYDFDDLDFAMNFYSRDKYPGSNVDTYHFNIEHNIRPYNDILDRGTATLRTEVFVFTESGVIQLDGNDFNVKRGMMKFNIIVETWPFCHNCKDTDSDIVMNGAYLDVRMEVKSKHTPIQGKKPGSFEFGEDIVMTTPRTMKLDGSDTATMMMEGYPALRKQGSKNTFTFRFPKFTSKVVYDPTVSVADVEPADPNSATGNVVSVLALAFCAILKFML